MSNEVKIDNKRVLVAFGTIKIAGAAITAATTQNVGAVAVRTGAGVVTLTLGQAVPAANCIVGIFNRQSPAFNYNVADTSDTVKTVSTFDATAGGATAADRNFDYEIWEILPG